MVEETVEKKLTGVKMVNFAPFKKLETKSCEELREDISQCNKVIEEQKAEIERLKTEFKTDWRNSWKNKFFTAMEENRELHKQVDELENRFENKAHCNMSENCSMVQQAVKGTAKEIYDKVEEIWVGCMTTVQLASTIKKWIKERYGVEVE
jgi:predicted nuclease with TOPRIM domain